MFRRTFRQQCRKCKGSGVSNKVLKNRDDQVMLAPAYHNPNDNGRPQYESCPECDYPGSGMALYDTMKSYAEVEVEGAKFKLTPEEIQNRFNDAPLA